MLMRQTDYLMKNLIALIFIFISINSYSTVSQQDTVSSTPQQYPGLGKAASGIYFSEKPWSLSGFGEINKVLTPGFTPDKDALSDIELYYNNLYRLATFFGYRISNSLIINTEIQIEHLSAEDEHHTELNFELFFDYRFKDALNFRLGFHPIGIGYINSNDEPVLFYSVNRPESERIILPSTWIELGLTAYGQLNDRLSYFVSLVSGLDAQHFKSATWVRNGREAFDLNSLALAAQLNYTLIKDLNVNLSGYIGNNGNYNYTFNNQKRELNSKLSIISGYLNYTPNNFRFLASGSYGHLSNTKGIYELTNSDSNDGQVLGEAVYGFYTEAGVDILHWLWPNRKSVHKKLWSTDEMELPIFIRFEKLDTHASISKDLQHLPRVQNKMNILAIGANYYFTEDIVIKANYQFRKSLTPADFSIPTGDYLEFGLGFNF